jgi:hypothetical protein
MRQRWGRKLDGDPFWNPNLSLATAEFGLAFPPWDQRQQVRNAA